MEEKNREKKKLVVKQAIKNEQEAEEKLNVKRKLKRRAQEEKNNAQECMQTEEKNREKKKLIVKLARKLEQETEDKLETRKLEKEAEDKLDKKRKLQRRAQEEKSNAQEILRLKEEKRELKKLIAKDKFDQKRKLKRQVQEEKRNAQESMLMEENNRKKKKLIVEQARKLEQEAEDKLDQNRKPQRRAEEEKSNVIRTIQSRSEPLPRFQGLCIQGRHDEEEMWKWSEEILSFLTGTRERCGKNSPIQDLKGLGTVEKGKLLRGVLVFLLPSVKVDGISFCEMSLCAYPNCPRSICFEHGWGYFCKKEYRNEYEDNSDYFESRSCVECDNQFCWLHFEDITKECQVCVNQGSAEVSLGCYDSAGNCPHCPRHYPVMCPGYGGMDVEDRERMMNGEDPVSSDYDHMIEEMEPCGFMCCSTCLKEHRCGDNSSGDDSSEYC